MAAKNMRSIYPIAWLLESPKFVEFMKTSLSQNDREFLVADFASGEHDRIPSFFISLLPTLSQFESMNRNIMVYCIDLHGLRLDSLLGKLEEKGIQNRARVVQSKLELMNERASFRPDLEDYLQNHPENIIWLDDILIGENRFPPECFDIGILNNDIVGYLMEYYSEYSNALTALSEVHKVIIEGGLLVVTMPCSLYVFDNIKVLHDIGFEYMEGFDIDIKNDHITSIELSTNPETLSRLGHYTFLIFKKH